MKHTQNPLIIAHRGGSALAPENTLFAIRKAIELGADGVEFDLQITRDEEIVLYHDDRLNPKTTRQGRHLLEPPTPRVHDLSLDELKRLDLGRDDRYANSSDYPDFQANPGEQIASFDEFMALIMDFIQDVGPTKHTDNETGPCANIANLASVATDQHDKCTNH